MSDFDRIDYVSKLAALAQLPMQGKPFIVQIFQRCDFCRGRRRFWVTLTVYGDYFKREDGCWNCGMETIQGNRNAELLNLGAQIQCPMTFPT